jgi:hypothetical protein
MSGGGGSESHSVSYSGSGQPWAQRYARAGVGAVQDVFNKQQPGLQALTDIAQKQAVPALLDQFKTSNPVASQAAGYNSDVLSGKYLNQGNPYIQNVLRQLNEGVANDVNSQFEMSGRYGSGAHADILSKNLANADQSVLYNDYMQQQARMDQAAQQAQAGNLGNAGLLQSMLGVGAELPYTGSNNLANSLGALFSGGSEKTDSKQSGPGLLGSLLGAGSSIASAAIMASDIRLKTNVRKVGEYPDGLGKYEWNWKNDPDGKKVSGVLAHEVRALRPQAYVPNYRGSGFDAVNYGAL